MTPTPTEIGIMVGAATSFAIWLAKVIWHRYDIAPTLYKLVPAVLLPMLTVGFAAQWQVGWTLVWQMCLAILTSLVAYGFIGRPALESIRADRRNVTYRRAVADATTSAEDTGG